MMLILRLKLIEKDSDRIYFSTADGDNWPAEESAWFSIPPLEWDALGQPEVLTFIAADNINGILTMPLQRNRYAAPREFRCNPDETQPEGRPDGNDS